MTKINSGVSGRVKKTLNGVVKLLCTAPGKSHRAVPKLGANMVSPTNILPSTKKLAQAGVCPGVCHTVTSYSPILNVSPSSNSTSN